MALDESARLELLEALKAAGVAERVAIAAQSMGLTLIDAKAEGGISARLWKRAQDCTAVRNGSRAELVSRTAGDLALRIPNLRTGSFFDSLLARRRRFD